MSHVSGEKNPQRLKKQKPSPQEMGSKNLSEMTKGKQ